MQFLLQVVSTIEGNKKWINLNPKGEPQLGKRGLYKQMGGENKQKDYQMAILWVLNQSDGKHSLLDIAIKSGINFETVVTASQALQQADLLEESE